MARTHDDNLIMRTISEEDESFKSANESQLDKTSGIGHFLIKNLKIVSKFINKIDKN